MANFADLNLILRVDHIKYRKAGDGRSPIGRFSIFKEYVEWRDNGSPEVLTLKFIDIKGQRVSPPHKAKVQLQLILQNEEQATFVFLNPGHDKNELVKERDSVKEALQQALIAHRAHVNQLAASVEKGSKTVELEAKQKILWQNKQLEQLYKHLVTTKLISPQDFWADYYKNEGEIEDKMGINGAFLANIAQQEGTNGIKLNLNPEIIQAIFATYPAVEKKHLELVPHEMTEATFWSKFFQSHYFHREREVLPNPKDPFAECVKGDEAEMTKMNDEGVRRRRFDLDHIDDNALRHFVHKTESERKSAKATLIKRCNYLSEKILATSWREAGPSSSTANGEESGTSNGGVARTKGFAVLNRVITEDEKRLESDELADKDQDDDYQRIKIDEQAGVETRTYAPDEAMRYKAAVLNFFDSKTDEQIINSETSYVDAMDVDYTNGHKNGVANGKKAVPCPPPEQWGLSPAALAELRAVHGAVVELCRHFWACFPPITPELESKIERMEETMNRYEKEQLAQATYKYGRNNVEQCYKMILKVHERYNLYMARKKK